MESSSSSTADQQEKVLSLPSEAEDVSLRWKETLCELVAFLLANIAHSEEEWVDWGAPFLELVFAAQFGEREGRERLSTVEQSFLPLVGHGFALWMHEEEDKEEDKGQREKDTHTDTHAHTHTKRESDGFVVVSSVEERLTALLRPTVLLSQHALCEGDESSDTHTHSAMESALSEFLERFLRNALSQDRYDARARTVAQRVCAALDVSAQAFSEMEGELFARNNSNNTDGDGTNESNNNNNDSSNNSNNKGKSRSRYLSAFESHLRALPADSLAVSHRLWRVAFVAAGGGALCLSAALASSPLVLAATSSFSTSLSASLSATVQALYPLLSPATAASTSAVLDSLLLSLSVSLETLAAHTSGSLLPLYWTYWGADTTRRKMLKRLSDVEGLQLMPLHITPTQETHSVEGSDTEQNRDCVRVFLLVSGHTEKDVDPRALWGADGTIFLNDTSASETSSDKEKKDEDDVDCNNNGDESRRKDIINNEALASPHALETESEANTQAETGRETNEQGGTESLRDWAEVHVQQRGWWRELVPEGEEYLLLWEPALLSSLNESFVAMLRESITHKMRAHLTDSLWQLTPVYPLKRALTLPGKALGQLQAIDDVWVLATTRAEQAGKRLAMTLLREKRARKNASSSSAQRALTLVGYGMGARLIFYCLLALAEDPDGAGIVESAVLIGAPVSSSLSQWQQARRVVAHRLINCYARFDWLLAVLFRAKSWELGVAGLQPVHLSESARARERDRKVVPNDKNHSWAKGFLSQVVVHVKRELRMVLGAPVSSSLSLSPFAPPALKANEPVAGEEDTVRIEMQVSSAPPLPLCATQQDECDPAVARLSQKAVQALRGSEDVENVDVTDIVFTHSDYPAVLPTILKMIKL